MSGSAKVPLTFSELKNKHRQLRSGFNENFGLRIHRSLSWLNRAELSNSDADSQFIFFWISFNAAYAEDLSETNHYSERSIFENYFTKILSFDQDQIIYNAIWQKFTGPIRLFLDNKFVYQPFWNFHNGIPGYDDWDDRFQKSKKKIFEALSTKDTKIVLSTLFDRLYVLRNQIIHGGATWNSSVNRSQIRDGSNLMKFLMPTFIEIMMDNPSGIWGKPHYPVISDRNL